MNKTPKIGDILVSSWGWDQTNVDFYEVVAVTKSSVRIRLVKSKVVDGRVVAVPGEWKTPYSSSETDPRYSDKGALKRVKSARDGYAVTIESYSDAYLWDGCPMYDTHAAGHLGH